MVYTDFSRERYEMRGIFGMGGNIMIIKKEP